MSGRATNTEDLHAVAGGAGPFEPPFLVDGRDTLAKLFLLRCETLGERTAHREKELGVWRSHSWAAFLDAARAIGLGLADQGVTDDELVVGSVSDLSGIFAAFGAPAVATAQMHFDAVNAAGGIHGRTIRFVVEDSGYQMPKAMQAYNKLLNRDKVFAMLLSIGTPMNIAGLKLMTPKNVLNLTPLSAARQLLDEPIRLRFVGTASYYEQMRLAAGYMAETPGPAPCTSPPTSARRSRRRSGTRPMRTPRLPTSRRPRTSSTRWTSSVRCRS